MTLAVNNDPLLVDSITITVYDNACLAARLGGGKEMSNPTDLDDDCDTDLADFAIMAEFWLESTEATGWMRY